MMHPYWNDWYFGWGWILWLGFIVLMFSSFGNWGYARRIHRRYSDRSNSPALDILDERYARGELDRAAYTRLKADILSPVDAGQLRTP